MPRAPRAFWSLALLPVLLLLLAPTVASGQANEPLDGPPPAVGAVVLADPLTEAGVVRASTCPTEHGARKFVADGFMLQVNGKCTDVTTSATVGHVIQGLIVPDGELRFDLQVVGSVDRLRFNLGLRTQADSLDRYSVALTPAIGLAQLQRVQNGGPTVLAESRDPALALTPDRWYNLAVRLQGPSVWLLLDDQPVLAASDAIFDTGSVNVSLTRLGDLDDREVVAVILRNLTVSGLAADQTRQPTYEPPLEVPAASPTPAT